MLYGKDFNNIQTSSAILGLHSSNDNDGNNTLSTSSKRPFQTASCFHLKQDKQKPKWITAYVRDMHGKNM